MNFETLIQEALSSGKTPEEIADSFSSSLNKAQSESELRKSLPSKYLKLFDQAYGGSSASPISLSDAINLVSAIIGVSHPEWTEENYKAFQALSKDSLEYIAKIINKKPKDILSDFFFI